MKKLIYTFMMALSLAVLSSCDSDDTYVPNPDNPSYSTGAFFLTQGNYTHVPGGLFALDYATNKMAPNVFQAVNGISLGDTPQCGVCYGSKIYIGVSASNVIFVLNKSDFKMISQIRLAGHNNGQQPRSMVAHNGKVYISMYDGYVNRMDTTTLVIDASVKVGPNPEIMAIYKNKLYVPNSDGMSWPNYGNTASVIDLDSFVGNSTQMNVSATITVPLNPAQFITTDNALYLLAKGNYGDIPSKLYKIDGINITEIAEATIVAASGNKVYYINQPYIDNKPAPAQYRIYDEATGKSSEWKVQPVDYANNIAIDQLGGRIFISSFVMDGVYPSYTAAGYVNEYNLKTAFVRKYEIGAGPACIFFDRK